MPVRIGRYARPEIGLPLGDLSNKTKMLGLAINHSPRAVNQKRPGFWFCLSNQVMGITPYHVDPTYPPGCPDHFFETHFLVSTAEHQRKKWPRMIMDFSVLVFVDIAMQVDGQEP